MFIELNVNKSSALTSYLQKLDASSKETLDLNVDNAINRNNVHAVINKIRFWNPKIKFMAISRLSRSSTIIVRGKLKNIFLRVTGNENCWYETERILELSERSLFSDNLYETTNVAEFSPLRKFLLEIYLLELDRYVNQFSMYTSVSSNALSLNNRNFFNPLSSYLPIKLKKFLSLKSSIKVIYRKKFIKLKTFSSSNLFFTFVNFISYLRYVDNFLIGFISSKKFSSYFQSKIYTFIRSNLHFDITKSIFHNVFDEGIYFAGYNIKLTNSAKLNSIYISKAKSYKKYFLRVLEKLELSLRIKS